MTPDEDRVLNQSRTVNKEAYDAYLMGLFYMDKLSRESLEKALEYFNIAIDLDPDWALPYSGVAQVWLGMAQMGFATPEISGPVLMENLNKALELDPDLAVSHFTQAQIGAWAQWNWEMGEEEFLKAIELNPNDPMSRIFYAHLLMTLQRIDEAITQGQLAVDLDPMNPLVLSLYAVVLSGNNQWDKAYEHVSKAVSIDPFSFFAHHIMEFVAYEVGETNAFIKAIRFIFPFEDEVFLSIERIAKEEGLQEAYRELVVHLEVLQQSSFLVPVHMANRYARINQKNKLLDQLELGFEIHDQNMPYIATGFTKLEPAYGNPRFLDLIEKLNLPMPGE